MRPASSFLLSLLMFASILGVQLAVMWAAGSQGVVTASYALVIEQYEYGADVLQEFEEDVEDDALEYSIHRPHRLAEPNTAQDERTELFGPPEEVAVGIAAVREPPQEMVPCPTSPWPDRMLRPPSLSLPLAGKLQHA
ncbi:hypothetical protein KUF54_04060 [Comamonas sp. Y33R10-2]|uniref:hypothetical protein n=1 Tax=Comamonas sp. Y33R10-2 TaxID=2853257 RepID=UPI001C5C861C|nr:hypothetical protein [Comamonas sp. Y33R10-2]QXZ10416.1 hypothetical protein KUF54_04060 [Comamonas sp. Y33R10-2]